MSTSVVTVRLNSEDKNTFASMCESLGMNTSTAINMFIKDCIKQKSILRLKCEPEEVDENGFTKSQMDYLQKSIEQLEQGKVVEYKQDDYEEAVEAWKEGEKTGVYYTSEEVRKELGL